MRYLCILGTNRKTTMELAYTLLNLLNSMSPYILLGFMIAGLLHAFVPASSMSRHLSGTGFKAVFKAAMIGVPLPLCSCGVLPTAVALRRSGASRAASSSFLIATPQTGVDSIAATYSLLGPAFAVIRPVAALVTSLAGGMAVGYTEQGEETAVSCSVTPDGPAARLTFGQKMREAVTYGFYTMVGSIGKWLIIGLVIAALITVFVPADFFTILGNRPLPAMIAVVLVAVPMYVCATGSIPIALSLILKGLSPGTAFVFLMAGPAANFASITVISRTMGRRAASAYLASIIIGAIAFGLAIDYLLPASWFTGHLTMPAHACHHTVPVFQTVCSGILLLLLLAAFVPPMFRKSQTNNNDMMTTVYKIKGMSCAHCKATVEKNLSRLAGVENVVVDLGSGTATVSGDHDPEAAYTLIEQIGFEPIR